MAELAWHAAGDESEVVIPPQGDIILVGLRDYQDEKADVILKCAHVHACICALIRYCSALGWLQYPGMTAAVSNPCRYMADEARSLKAYGELPDSSEFCPPLAWSICDAVGGLFPEELLLCNAVRVNETDTFADEDGANDEYFDFEDISGALLSTRHGPVSATVQQCVFTCV